MLKQQIQDDINAALKEKKALKVSTLRMLFSAIRYFEISQGKDYQANEDDIAKIILKESKKRKDSIEMFKKGNRQDLVTQEQTELKILGSYLPDQIGEDEIRAMIKDTIAQTGANTIKDRGKVIGIIMGKTKGTADGNLVSKLVKESL